MESGLDGRNNLAEGTQLCFEAYCLNGVRPRWPEQSEWLEALPNLTTGSQWSPA